MNKRRATALFLTLGMMMTVLAGGTAPRAAQAGAKNYGDYLPAHNWKIEIDGVIAGGFKEISGIESEVEVVEFKDGDDAITHKRAGKAKYKNITLKRGFMGEDTIFARWVKLALDGKVERKSGSIIYLDRAGQEVLRYNFFEAWPSRRKIAPVTDSNGQTEIVEEIEFVVEKVERA